MTERALPLVSVLVVALGCSVLVNTDYTGGKEPAASNVGGHAGTVIDGSGGTLFGSGGSIGESGTNEGGQADMPADAGAGNEVGMAGGTETGGSEPSGGTGGGTGASGGTDGGAGESTGGTAGTGMMGGAGGLAGSAGASGSGALGGDAGLGGSASGAGGSAGLAGMSGAGVAGGPSCNADLMNDPTHCGSCDKACADGVACEAGICVTSPCAGLCLPATTIPDPYNDGYREDGIPATDGCYETTMYSVTGPALPSLICWNVTDRTVQVNGVTVPCTLEPGVGVPAARGGGYCVQFSASKSGDTSDGFKFPTPGQLMPAQ